MDLGEEPFTLQARATSLAGEGRWGLNAPCSLEAPGALGVEPKPVYGEGFFHISPGVIYYTIVFDYVASREYSESLRDPRRRREEEEYARRRMQELMDEERIVINGRDVRAVVDYAGLFFRGGLERHSMVFHIYMEYDPIPDGLNVYENFYPASRAPYPYTVYWVAPPGGEIVEVEGPGRWRRLAGGRIAVITVRRGEWSDGYESVAFRLTHGLDGEA